MQFVYPFRGSSRTPISTQPLLRYARVRTNSQFIYILCSIARFLEKIAPHTTLALRGGVFFYVPIFSFEIE
jgi:hypothetical protein